MRAHHYLALAATIPTVICEVNCTEEIRDISKWNSSAISSLFDTYWSSPDYQREINISRLEPSENPLKPWVRLAGLSDEFLDGYYLEPDDFLDGLLHPLVEQSHWIVNAPNWNTTFHNMRPALRLVTKFLTEDAMLDWFVQIQDGYPTTTPDGIPFLELPDGHDHEPWDPAKDRARRGLAQMSKHVRFTWVDSKLAKDSSGAVARLPIFMSLLNKQTGGCRPKGWSYFLPSMVIYLRLGYFGFFADLQRPNSDKILPLQFSLAGLIMHEIAHAWFDYQRVLEPDRLPASGEIRAFATDVFPESGFSWEQKTLGGGFFCMDHHRCTSGLEFLPHEDRFPIYMELSAIVPMPWIQQWFRTETWKRIHEIKEAGRLDPPHTQGCPDLIRYMRYNTTSRKFNIYIQPSRQYLNFHESSNLKDAMGPECSVRDSYRRVWDRDAQRAFRDGVLDKRYYKPTAYAHLFSDYKGPVWASKKSECGLSCQIQGLFQGIVPWLFNLLLFIISWYLMS
jgi:hypothetical protein